MEIFRIYVVQRSLKQAKLSKGKCIFFYYSFDVLQPGCTGYFKLPVPSSRLRASVAPLVQNLHAEDWFWFGDPRQDLRFCTRSCVAATRDWVPTRRVTPSLILYPSSFKITDIHSTAGSGATAAGLTSGSSLVVFFTPGTRIYRYILQPSVNVFSAPRRSSEKSICFCFFYRLLEREQHRRNLCRGLQNSRTGESCRRPQFRFSRRLGSMTR